MNINGVSSQSGTPAATNGTAATSAAGQMDGTFLTLLVTELKTQDPTSPMDPTQMVGQMVSLNQLDQLIQIHQLLQASSSAATAAPTVSSTGGN